MKKGKALLAVGFNLKAITKIPAIVKKAMEDIKGDLTELKEAVEDIKANLPLLSTNGGKCAAGNVSTPLDCYRLIYGPIRYTPE